MVQLSFRENTLKVLLHDYDNEFIEKCQVVPGLSAVPDGKEEQSQYLANVTVSEELESLVDILCGKVVGVTIEAVYVMLELGGILELV